MEKVSEQFALIGTIKSLGFGDRLFSPPESLSGCDAALRSGCYQAIVSVAPPSGSLLDLWGHWQGRIAEYRAKSNGIPRDIYLVLMVDAANPSATLENVDRVSRDTLVCRKIVSIVGPNGLRGAIETWPFLSFASSGTFYSTRALISVLDAFKDAGYDRKVVDTISGWISAERARDSLIASEPPSTIPEVRFENYSRALSETDEPPHRLHSISIKDFRGLRNLDIDLSADLILVHGRNGTGKTSLFDAFEWALLGDVEHIDSSAQEGDSRSPYVNLFSDTGEASVKLTLAAPQELAELSRTVSLNGEQTVQYKKRRYWDDKAALVDVLGDEARNLNLPVLRDLVRSSNFLAQTTLKRFFSKKPSDRYAAVSNLLGTHDYLKFLKKLDEIMIAFRKSAAKADREIANVADQIADKDADLIKLEAHLAESPAGIELDARLGSLLQQLLNDLGDLQAEVPTLSTVPPFLFEEVESFLGVVEEWAKVTSGALHSRLADVAFIEQSGVLLKQYVDQLRSLRSELLSINSQDDALRTEQEDLTAARRVLDEKLAGARNRLQTATTANSAASNLGQVLKQESELMSSSSDYLNKLLELTQIETRLKAESGAQRDYVARLVASTRQIAARLKSAEAELRAVYLLQSRFGETERLYIERKKLLEDIQKVEIDTPAQQAELSATSQQFEQIFAKIQANTRALESARAGLEQYRALISSLRAYLREASCPLCGQEYDSPEELSRRVDDMLQTEPRDLKRLDADTRMLQQKLKITIEAQDQLRAKISASAAIIRASNQRLSQIEANVSEIRTLSANAGLADAEVSLAAIQSRRAAIERQLTELNAERARTEADYALRVGADSIQDSQLRSTAEQRTSTEQSLNVVRQRLQELNTRKIQLVGIVGSDSPGSVANYEQKSAEDVRASSLEVTKLEQERTIGESRMRTAQSELSSLQVLKLSKEKQVANTSIQILQLSNRRAQVRELDQRNTAEIRGSIEGLLNRMNNIPPLVVDSRRLASLLLARRQATLVSDELSKLGRERNEMETIRLLHSRWETHLQDLADRISRARHEAENWQLKNYGPAISNLYTRFSAHPIFGVIQVTVDALKEEVRIVADVSAMLSRHVKYPSEGIAPLRYFSEAQGNVLALSVFMSNAFQQRWSRVNTIFMDDPVQNMDDLNANAFIDTIRALAATAGRQFIIATCDLHLYKLMLVKLGCLNCNGAEKRFAAYRLEGISVAGPRLIKDI